MDFDVEAQESLLSEEGVSEDERFNTVDATHKLVTCIICIRSTLLFISAHSSSSSSDDDNRDEDSRNSADAPLQIELQQLQREKVSEIVKNKSLEELRQFGGVEGAAEALNTDLVNGITSPQQTHSRNPNQPYPFLHTLFHSFLQSCNNFTVFLLFCATALSLGFGIEEDGLQITGLLNGCILLGTLLLIVVGTTIGTSLHKWWSNKSSPGGRMFVKVVRDGEESSVDEVDLVEGDIVIVQKGGHLPADGLLVGGPHHEALQLDDGSTIDERNPFLFYGFRVINGEARMLVTSTGMDTVWGEKVIRASNKESNLESYLNRLFLGLYFWGFLISILIMVALFLRYKAGKLDDERRYRPDSKGEPTDLKTFFDAMKSIITESKGTARVVFTLLSVSLVGIVEAVPFVISASSLMWSSKTLAHKALAKDGFTCANTAHLTTICTDISGALTGTHRLYVGDEFVCEISRLDSQVAQDLCEVIVGDSAADSYQLIKDKSGNGGIWHCKGPIDQILSRCSHHYGIDGQIREIDEEKERELQRIFETMLAEEGEATAYACKRIQGLTDQEYHNPPDHLDFLAMMSMRKSSSTTVSRLKRERVRIILASGEDVSLLTSVARKCGLLTPHHDSDDQVLTGEEFQRLNNAEREKRLEKLCILGNCSPDDRFHLVKCLKETGQVVGVVANTTFDAPTLKLADIGITYQGNSSSQIARDFSHIIILDSNCSCYEFLLKTIKSGRSYLENIRKFIQMQLIFSVSSSLINFIGTVALGDAPITAVELFWLNLVVALVGGLALLTDPTAVAPPTDSTEKLMTGDMCRNIVVQVVYQTSMFVGVQYWGQDMLGTSGDGVKLTVYNAFFLCQIFNTFIARQPRKMNIFSGLFSNSRCLWVALLLFVICQAAFAAAEELFGGRSALSFKLWGVCLVIAFISWPVDLAAKMVSFGIRWFFYSSTA